MKTLAAGFNSTANVIPTSAGYSWVDRRFSPLAFVQGATDMVPTRSAIPTDITELHVQFLAILPTIEQDAELAHRHGANFHDREDAIVETIAFVWTWFDRFAKRGNNSFVSPK